VAGVKPAEWWLIRLLTLHVRVCLHDAGRFRVFDSFLGEGHPGDDSLSFIVWAEWKIDTRVICDTRARGCIIQVLHALQCFM
jgi:hypothetical protein